MSLSPSATSVPVIQSVGSRKSEDKRNASYFTMSPLVSSKSAEVDNMTPRQGSRKVFVPPLTPLEKKPFIDAPRASPILMMRPADFPRPRPPSKCHLFCCFYAEFDNKVGPKVCYQSPRGFMDQEIDLSVERVHDILSETFKQLREHKTVGVGPQSPEDKDDSPAIPASGPSDGAETLASEEKETIFESCSEFIITGNELTGNIINLSTHSIHILSRPAMISDERYERNSLLFSVGFVIRRTQDPRPFRPVLSKIMLILRDLEIESQFLCNPETRPRIETLLDNILVSLNSSRSECNIQLTPSSMLHVKLFRPPKLPAIRVPEYAVPVLLRRERQVHMYDWDLAINWVSLHIDGVTNARQISKKAEVDMEMVLSCLRVLRHHGVIALVDMFFFSNHYESTTKAASMLSGKNPKLLMAAVEFVCRRAPHHPSANESSPFIQSMSPGLAVDHAAPSLASNVSHEIVTREDSHDVKIALAELYCACNRNSSIGGLWISFLAGRAASSLSGSVEWKKIFECIDHRRFATFGVVHGLIIRVHDFPMVLNTKFTEEERKLIENYANPIGPATKEKPRGGHKVQPDPLEHKKMAPIVASMMDGSRCDDELVCTFELPLEGLFYLVGDRQRVSSYAHGLFG